MPQQDFDVYNEVSVQRNDLIQLKQHANHQPRTYSWLFYFDFSLNTFKIHDARDSTGLADLN